jgi:hypothetical protein
LTLPDAALVVIDKDGQCPDTRPQGKLWDAGSITNEPGLPSKLNYADGINARTRAGWQRTPRPIPSCGTANCEH